MRMVNPIRTKKGKKGDEKGGRRKRGTVTYFQKGGTVTYFELGRKELGEQNNREQ